MALASVLVLPLARGQTVAWGTSVNLSPISYTSDGTVDNELLTWDLGWFEDGLVPDQANWTDWAAHWNMVDSSTYQDFGGMVVGGGVYTDLQQDSNAQPPNTGFATFEAQSFTWIPEPSVGLLGGMGLLLLLRRRR